MTASGRSTKIISHGEIDTSACEIYGKGKRVLRVGNGGAGATGLIRELAEDWLRSDPEAANVRVEWMRNHSRNTQIALLNGDIDIAFTYEREQEKLAEEEGWSRSEGCAFHDHFCLAGPVDDPAGVGRCSTIEEAFQAIYQTGNLFHSRVDSSATMWKESELWESASIKPYPWQDGSGCESWCRTSSLGPRDALIQAAKAGAYLLTDRSTLLHQTGAGGVSNIIVFFEPTSASSLLMNSCYMLTSPNPTAEADAFVSYVKGRRSQQLIASYGIAQVGKPLFAAIEAEYAKDYLRGGQPVNGRWLRSIEAARL